MVIKLWGINYIPFSFCARITSYIMRRINAGVGTELTVEANLYL